MVLSGETPSYTILGRRGPEHDKQFTYGVCFGGKCVALDSGLTAKVAKEKAAEKALKIKGWKE
jgi:dsRNA-specific ribonuclease